MNAVQHDQIIGLCDEIAAMARLRLPLEEALLYRSRDLPKELGDRVKELADKLQDGQSLADAIARDPGFPPVYSAIVRAGLESNNLPGTLELVSDHLRQIRDTRRFLIQSLLYPMFVFSILWTVFGVVFFFLGPVLAEFFSDFEFVAPFWEKLDWIKQHPMEYTLGFAAVLVLLWGTYFCWIMSSSRSALLTLRTPPGFFWARSINRELAKSTFAEIVSLLVQSGMPLPKVLKLAFETVGDKDWSKEPESLFEQRLQNQQTKFPQHPKSPLSNLVYWTLGVPDKTILLSGLKQYAEMGRIRARYSMERLELWLPVLLMLILGAIVFAAYFMMIIYPYGYLLYTLSR